MTEKISFLRGAREKVWEETKDCGVFDDKTS